MDIKAYIESGILELYVLGQLTPSEVSEVESMMQAHIEVKKEIHEIALGLEKYAQVQKMKPSEGVEDSLFNNLRDKSSNPSQQISEVTSQPKDSGNNWKLGTILGGLAAVLFCMLWYQNRADYNEKLSKMEQSQAVCDSIQTQSQLQFALLEQLKDPNIRILPFGAQEKFNQTHLYFYTNTIGKKNFIQVQNLPEIADNQDFQLWSLKDGQDPQPMDVFNIRNGFVEVGFVDQTATYAITIENKGGAQSPDLSNLVATVTVI